jgi:hypothetical protein
MVNESVIETLFSTAMAKHSSIEPVTSIITKLLPLIYFSFHIRLLFLVFHQQVN